MLMITFAKDYFGRCYMVYCRSTAIFAYFLHQYIGGDILSTSEYCGDVPPSEYYIIVTALLD